MSTATDSANRGPRPAATTAATIDDGLARRNALILAGCQALFGMIASTHIALGPLAGITLATQEAAYLATLPISMMMIGNVATVIPLGLLMRSAGRRVGFMLGATCGLLGMALCALAVAIGSFALFCFASLMLGCYMASAGYYRFAAADTASDAFRPKAISWALAGGVVAAIVGPELVKRSHDLLAPIPFAGSYVLMAIVGMMAILATAQVRIPKLPAATRAESGRPLKMIAATPVFIVAAMCGMVAYGLMNLLMTATPLAMQGCGFGVPDTAFVIQWHVLAMYGPSFVTGSIIARIGTLKVIGLGLAILILAAIVALNGISIGHFWAGLVLLGLGWNFAYVGATTLLTRAYDPAERAKTQALNDFLVFGTVTVASFASGGLFAGFGWATVLATAFPFALLAGLALAVFAYRERTHALAHT